ncbi:hypothetical protein OHB13_38575 (plasmid) [Streptomyces sp. NBC_00440]|uniref:hypothetical protein n=1 Tax=Streptomyces sp. NBC_00440 TaxID=2975741 RepID=UPI002E235B9F
MRVSTHPFWSSLGGEDLVAARMALKHVEDEVDLDDALTTLRRPGSAACKSCDAAESLMPLL